MDPERFGLKYGEKRQWYYKMRLDFFSDPDINMLNYRAILLFLGIIKQSLRENKGNISVCLEYYKDILRCSLGDIKVSVKELESFNLIELEVRVRTQLKEDNRIEENRIESNGKLDSVLTFDFESIYALYPRKSGKGKGLEICARVIATHKRFDSLKDAVLNYAREITRDEIEIKYTKQFSTFMNCWEDYLPTQAEIEKRKSDDAFIEEIIAFSQVP